MDVLYIGRLNAGSYSDGVIANVVLTNKSGAEDVVETYALDGNDTGITLYNIPEANRWKATLIDDDWVGNDELVVNGGFDTDTDWVKGAGWTISGGVANVGDYNADLSTLTTGLVPGNIYQSEITTSNMGDVVFYVGGAAAERITVDGVSLNNTAALDTSIARVRAKAAGTGTIDNVSVKRYLGVA